MVLISFCKNGIVFNFDIAGKSNRQVFYFKRHFQCRKTEEKRGVLQYGEASAYLLL